ncbi:MucR family transcriptional regulator [Ralstonia pseudosolanacearum]
MDRAALDAYLAHDRIECLVCGKRFTFLAPHLRRAHGMSADEYRQAFALPAMTPLAGLAYREAHRAKLVRMVAYGSFDYSHLERATNAAKDAPRPTKQPADALQHATAMQLVQPWNTNRLADGTKRADGRDADRAREYQQAYRALEAGDPLPMVRYRSKWQEDDGK